MVTPDLPAGWTLTGERRLLQSPLLGLVSSVQCPGSVIVQLLDAMRAVRSAGITVVGGFHSPVERECLELLLAGTQPIVLVQARATGRLSAALRNAMNDGRLAVLSPTVPGAARMSRALATARNELVDQLAAALLVPYAAPGGATEQLVERTLLAGKDVLTIADPSNSHIVTAGARAVTPAGASGIAESLLAMRRTS
ncbi:MAG: hypothetical protein FIB00_12580 [Chloroflexi bacterium]|nr:hypothetical protein [Chloroflexota bacterium]PWB45574.1 MAG: hypothetical protein C3F10_05665 [Dehalococcoidia bacterium]